MFFNINQLSISFGGIRALEDISIDVKQGEVYSIIGPNGAGKTTLFNCISGIYRADEGRIQFNGHEIQRYKPDRIARMGIARTFQNIELFSAMSTMENIMLGRHIYFKTRLLSEVFMWGRRSRNGREEIHHRLKVEEIIDFLELQSARNIPVGALPYGTQKLVELGRALALEPKVLLLDEPVAGMNAEEKQDMIFWIKDIRDELGVTILLIDHDMSVIMDISDRVLVINFGRKIAEGTPDEVQQHPEVLKAYLGEVTNVEQAT